MVKIYKIWVTDEFDKEPFDELDKSDERISVTYGSLENGIEDTNIIVTRSKTKVNEELVDKMQNLKCVISATHGTDHVDIDYLKEKGIKFYNAPVQSYDISQGVMAYILAYSTNLLEADRSMKRGEWKKKELRGYRIKGKTLGIIGYGRIGKEVATMASAFEINVVAYDPYVKDNEFAVTLDELLETSDFITIHTPLTKKTKHMIGKNEISKMKNGAYLINTSRGGVVEEEALLEGLETGKLDGAALDVFEHNPPFGNYTSNKIIKNEKVIVTPHSIGQTQEAIDEKHEGAMRIIKDYINKNNEIKCE